MPTSDFTKPGYTQKRRTLRAQRPVAERILWSKLNAKQIHGFKIRRQHGIGPYVVDFYCVEAKLAIELDGMSHDSEAAESRDDVREAYIASQGVLTIRFLNKEVMESAESVAEKIGVVLMRRVDEIGNLGADLP
jgi:very-short-patch-repair endonuclease